MSAAINQVQTRPVTAQGWKVLAVLSALIGCASISTDFYLPAMPTMGCVLGAGAGAAEWTISGYLIGFSFGQLLWGPIGDRFGRRVPVAIGLALFIAGSAGCALSGTIWAVIGWRVVQAIGAAAGVVLGRAMVRDLYEGHRAAQMMSTLITIMAIAPLLGPIIGGQVLVVSGWRAIFWTLVAIGLAMFAALWTLQETLPLERRSDMPLSQALAQYGRLLRDRRLLGYAGAGGCFYGAMFAYIAGTPFAYITYHHLDAQAYGFLFAAGILGIMATNSLNARLVPRFGGDRLLQWGAGFAAITGILLAITARTDWFGLWGLAVPLFLFVAMAGFIVANSVAGALADFPTRAGAVSALIGSMQYGSGIFSSALVGFFADGTPWPMGWVIATAGIGSFLCARLIVTRAPRVTKQAVPAQRPSLPTSQCPNSSRSDPGLKTHEKLRSKRS